MTKKSPPSLQFLSFLLMFALTSPLALHAADPLPPPRFVPVLLGNTGTKRGGGSGSAACNASGEVRANMRRKERNCRLGGDFFVMGSEGGSWNEFLIHEPFAE